MWWLFKHCICSWTRGGIGYKGARPLWNACFSVALLPRVTCYRCKEETNVKCTLVDFSVCASMYSEVLPHSFAQVAGCEPLIGLKGSCQNRSREQNCQIFSSWTFQRLYVKYDMKTYLIWFLTSFPRLKKQSSLAEWGWPFGQQVGQKEGSLSTT